MEPCRGIRQSYIYINAFELSLTNIRSLQSISKHFLRALAFINGRVGDFNTKSGFIGLRKMIRQQVANKCRIQVLYLSCILSFRKLLLNFV